MIIKLTLTREEVDRLMDCMNEVIEVCKESTEDSIRDFGTKAESLYDKIMDQYTEQDGLYMTGNKI